MDKSIKILNKFQNSLISFFDELIETFPQEKQFIVIRILIKDQIPSTQVMSYFIEAKKNEDVMDSIKNRNDKFFLENKLFLKIANSDLFKEIWLNLKSDEKDIIWLWVDSFMNLTEEYMTYN